MPKTHRIENFAEYKQFLDTRYNITFTGEELKIYEECNAIISDIKNIFHKGAINIYRGMQYEAERSGRLETLTRTRNFIDEIQDNLFLGINFYSISSKNENVVDCLVSAEVASRKRDGNCAEYTSLALKLLVLSLFEKSQLAKKRVICKEESTVRDHTWLAIRESDGKVRDSDIIIDAWSSHGFAVRRKDCIFNKNNVEVECSVDNRSSDSIIKFIYEFERIINKVRFKGDPKQLDFQDIINNIDNISVENLIFNSNLCSDDTSREDCLQVMIDDVSVSFEEATLKAFPLVLNLECDTYMLNDNLLLQYGDEDEDIYDKSYDISHPVIQTEEGNIDKKYYGDTALHYALKCGFDNIARALIRAGANIEILDKNGNTPLEIAIMNGSYVGVVDLILYGSDVNYKDVIGVTLLHKAAAFGYSDIVEELINNGAEIEAEDDCGYKPLCLAKESNHIETVKLIESKLRLANKCSKSFIHKLANNSPGFVSLER